MDVPYNAFPGLDAATARTVRLSNLTAPVVIHAAGIPSSSTRSISARTSWTLDPATATPIRFSVMPPP